MAQRRLLLLLLTGTAGVINTPAWAQAGDCSFFEDLSPQADIAIATVTASRVHFLKDKSEDPSCPSESAACRDRAYLVKGNEVLVRTGPKSFVCAIYLGPKDRMRFGWLPAASIVRRPADPPRKIDDWLGEWSFRLRALHYRDQGITIRRAAANRARLHIQGGASYADDAASASKGSVNVGEIRGEAAPEGATLAFTHQGEDGPTPPDDDPDDACRVQMRLVGRYLLVNDNWKCGGLNVTFAGVYQRRQR